MLEPTKNYSWYQIVFLILEHNPELADLLTLEINLLREPLTVICIHLQNLKWSSLRYLAIWLNFQLFPNFFIWKLLELYDLVWKYSLKYVWVNYILQSLDCLWYFMWCIIEPLWKLALCYIFDSFLYKKMINVLFLYQKLQWLTRVRMIC